MSGRLKTERSPSDDLQHIQFEGCDVCVIAPEDYDAMANALTARAWHPIETAPKDRLIDIWIPNHNGGGTRWSCCYYDRVCDEWRTSRPSGHLVHVSNRHVTHWMEVPEEPK